MALAEHRIAHREAAACTCNSHCRNVVVFCRLTRTYLPNSNTHINTGRLAACHGKLWEDIFVGLRLKDLQIAKNVLPSVLSEQRHKKALVSVRHCARAPIWDEALSGRADACVDYFE